MRGRVPVTKGKAGGLPTYWLVSPFLRLLTYSFLHSLIHPFIFSPSFPLQGLWSHEYFWKSYLLLFLQISAKLRFLKEPSSSSSLPPPLNRWVRFFLDYSLWCNKKDSVNICWLNKQANPFIHAFSPLSLY